MKAEAFERCVELRIHLESELDCDILNVICLHAINHTNRKDVLHASELIRQQLLNYSELKDDGLVEP